MNKLQRCRQNWTDLFMAIMPALILFFAMQASGQKLASTQVNGAETGRHIAIGESQVASVEFVGAQDAVKPLESGQAQAVSLARGDFDQDGIEDLVAGYATPGGKGIVVLFRGNLDAFAPQSQGSWQAIANNDFPPTFLSLAAAFPIPAAADFLATGSFLGTDHMDVVTAKRGDSTLYLLAGDGNGNLASAEPIRLPGTVTAMAAGRFGASNSRSTVVVGIGGSSPSLLVFSGTRQGLSLVSEFNLTAPASSFAFDDLDGDGRPDAVMISGQGVSILHATGSTSKSELEALSLPVSAVAVTTGFFIHDRGWRRQMAVLDMDGSVHVVAHGGFDSRGWTKAEVVAMRAALRHGQPNPSARTESAPATDGWKIVETLPAVATHGSGGLMLSSRIFGQGTDDVLVIDPGSGKIAVASHPRVTSSTAAFIPARLSTRAYSSGTAVAAMSFPVNVDAREGLVVLHRGQTMPAVMMPVSARALNTQPPQEGK